MVQDFPDDLSLLVIVSILFYSWLYLEEQLGFRNCRPVSRILTEMYPISGTCECVGTNLEDHCERFGMHVTVFYKCLIRQENEREGTCVPE